MPLPFQREPFTFQNPDGSELQVLGWGNQYQAVFETLDGYSVVTNPENGYWEFAELSTDRTELTPTGQRANQVGPGALTLPQHLRVRRGAARSTAAKSPLLQTDRIPRWLERRNAQRSIAESLSDIDAAPPSQQTVGDYEGLCLLIDFPDVASTIQRAEVDNFCNQPGYGGFANNGSVRDYFIDVSANRFRYTNTVTEYYTAVNNRSYYTDPSITFGTRTRELITEALDSLVADGFDFSGLSADGSGSIYALNVFYAGARVNNWSEGLWPHAWVLASPYDIGGGRAFNDYQITNMGSSLALRTFCHENGHMVCDFPDLYDYGSDSMGIGHFCLMCNGGAATNPVHVNGYLKLNAGWITGTTEYVPGAAAQLIAGTNTVYRHSKSATEYFIIENRQQQDRDAAIPDSGLAIWHVDHLGSNDKEERTPTSHYECSLEQADGQFDMESNTNAGDADDLFSGSGAAFTGITTPNSQWWDGSASGLSLEEISASAATMTFNTSGGTDMSGVVGTWPQFGIDWGNDGTIAYAGPFTFNADNTWTYPSGGGKWTQVGDLVFFTFNNAADLTYVANINRNTMNGIMGYVGTGSRGVWYGLRTVPPAPAAPAVGAMPTAAAKAVLGPQAPGGTGGVDPVTQPC